MPLPRPTTAAALVLAAGLTAGCGGGGGSAAPAPAPSPTVASPAAASPSASPSDGGYGSYPGFLPADTLDGATGPRVVDASVKDPTLATQGDTVRVHVGRGTALVTVAGPAVPVSGQPVPAPASPATWQVELRGTRGRVPLDPAAFEAIDESGRVHRLQVQDAAPRRLPRTLTPGHAVRFALFDPAFETGEGRMRWIPVGHLAPVEWDFVVETD